MPRLLREQYMNPIWFCTGIRAILIVNDSKTTLHVALDNPVEVTGLKPGHSSLYHITNESVRVTISYYTKDRIFQDICTKNLLNNGRRLRIIDSQHET